MSDRFWGIFWIDVSTEATAIAGFLKVAKILGVASEDIENTLHALSNAKHDWLIVLDNADDREVDYSLYFPSGTRGAVLLTSRVPASSCYNTVGTEDLQSLDPSSCLNLLLQAAGIPKECWSEQEPAAERVIKVLGSHTLALVQAGAAISQGYCSIENYPEEYQRQCKRLMEFCPQQAQSRYRNVYATFEASAHVLESSNDGAQQDALQLLHLLAMFHYDKIPLLLFEDASQGVQYARKIDQDDSRIDVLSKWHVSQLPQFMEEGLESWDPFRLHRARNILESLALVTTGKDNDYPTISMHPLAHNWTNIRQQQVKDQSYRSAGCLYALSHYRINGPRL
jgi:hypothetical protein